MLENREKRKSSDFNTASGYFLNFISFITLGEFLYSWRKVGIYPQAKIKPFS